MTDDVRRLIEAQQTLQHLHDIADAIAERMRGLPDEEAEAMLDRELAALALIAKRQATRSGSVFLVDEIAFKLRAVVRERVRAKQA